MSTIGEINAKTQSREDAEKTENILAAKIIEAAIEVYPNNLNFWEFDKEAPRF